MKQPSQTFNDGTCGIYIVANIGERGKKPTPLLTVKHPLLRYAERMVGMQRFWQARQNGVAVDKVIRIARLPDISTQDIAMLEDGKQYDIVQVQAVQDMQPSCADLSLRRRDEYYDIG